MSYLIKHDAASSFISIFIRRTSITVYAVILCCLLVTNDVQAQFNMLFTSDYDLPNSLVNDIEEDSDGMLWIATEDGLCQYNGSRFKNYSNHPNDKNSIKSNFIRCICTDKRGNVVIATISGLQIYCRCKDNFSELIATEGIGLPTTNVNDVCLLKNGDFLAIGVNSFTLHINDDGTTKVSRNVLSNCKLNGYHVLEDKDGTLWAEYGPNGIWHTDKNGKMHCIKTPEGTNYNFASICFGNDGRLYAGHVEGGLYVYNSSTRHFDLMPGTERIMKIRDMGTLPNSNTMCIATDGSGVQFYDVRKRDFVYVENIDDPFLDISSQKAHSVYVNKNGDIWLALYQKGIFLATKSVSSFGYIGNRSQNHNIIGNRCVTALVERHDGTIWVATDNGGVYGFTNTIQPVRSIPANDNGGIPMTTMTLFEDSKQRMWFGAYNHGGGMFDVNTGQCHYIPLEGVENNLFSAYGYVEDKRGQLWVATLGNGIIRYDEASGMFKPYLSTANTTWTTSIYYDKYNDKIYCGTYDGIRWFSPTDPKRKVHTIGPNAVVYSIARISAEELVFGSTNGIIVLNTKTGKTRNISTQQGLPSNNIFTVQPYGNGQLWMSSSSGLIHYDLKTGTMETYTVRDGLQGNEFYKNSSMKSRDGRIWFGGVNGISYFHPSEITSRENLKCVSRVVSLRAGEKYIIADGEGCFTIPSGIDVCNIELATLPLYMTKRVTYYYRLDNGKWQMLPIPQNRILFDNLSYGSHTLYTKTVIDDKESEVTMTKIYVSYPWYLKWWAVLIWLTIIGIGIYYVIRGIRHRRQLHYALIEHRHVEEMKEAKLQFFMNIVHDLRTPLTLIATPLQKLMGAEDDPRRKRLYGIMDRNTDRLLRLTNEIMDLRKIDSGKMELHCHHALVSHHIHEIVNSMSDMVETRHQQLVVSDRTDGNLKMWIDLVSFEKILVNLLSNAIKYTPEGGMITVEWMSHNNDFVLYVTDNGIGVTDEEKKHIFDRFYQVRVNDKHIKGTGIGLNLVKSLVELHHGTISIADNPEGKGTRFILTLPTNAEAYSPEERDEGRHEKNIRRIEDLSGDGHDMLADAMTQSEGTEQAVDGEPSADTENAHADSSTPAAAFSEPGKTIGRKTVLVVDDDDEIRTFLYEELSGAFNVIECADGKAAYDILVKGVTGTTPLDHTRSQIDIIVSDVMMPEVDGIELTHMIRQNVRLSHLPIILLTAKSSDQDRIEGLQATADAYVTKPFNLDLLQTLIVNLLLRQEKLRNTFKGNELPTDKIDTPDLQSADDRLMERLLKVLNDNLDNPDLTSDMLAREVGLSRGHLYRKLKELTNQSATNYIRNIRLTKAAELLRQHKTTVSEVAYMVGFRTPNHFSTAFKDLYGITPSEYIKAQ